MSLRESRPSKWAPDPPNVIRDPPIFIRRCPHCKGMFYNEKKYHDHLVQVEGYTTEQGGQHYHTYDPDKRILYFPIKEEKKT